MTRMIKPYSVETSVEGISKAFCRGDLRVGVYGLGKMGLPLAAVYADVSGNTVGVDVDPAVVETVNSGESHVRREPGLDSLVEKVITDGSLTATTEYGVATESAQIHVIIVPTPITESNAPDLSILRETVRRIGSGLTPGDLVVVECTVPPRTSREIVKPILADKSGLSTSEFGVAMCPERTASGRALQDIRGSYPKIVGGVDKQSTDAAKAIYQEITDNEVLTCSNATTAEAVKLFEGLYRDVNIAIANELARFTDELGIDVNEALETANTAPYVDLHSPGPGVGGHCIPYYPYFLIHPFETEAPLLRTARKVNDSMPDFTVGKLREEFDVEGRDIQESIVLVFGLTYRPGVNEIRATPALPIAERLDELGADVRLVDPVLEDFSTFPGTPTSLKEIYDCNPDAAVIVTPQEEFDGIEWRRFDQLVIIDGRQSLDLAETPHRVYTIGSGWQ